MLTIAIPIFNYDVNQLVNDLCRQAVACGKPFEIILIDDASEQSFRLLNAKLDFIPHVSYLQNMINMGRSKLRNLLINKANFPYILLLDCDSSVKDDQFIAHYIDKIDELKSISPFVINGGTAYQTTPPKDSDKKLRWYYGSHREAIPAVIRNNNPYQSFVPFNVLITKSVFDTVSFNEELSTYGHEDTLFGYELREHNIPIIHIDNQLYHNGIDNNNDYLNKIESAIKNMTVLIQNEKYHQLFMQDNKLLRCYAKVARLHLTSIIDFLYRHHLHQLRKYVVTHTNLLILDIYKLGFFTNCIKEQNKKGKE